MLSFYNKILPIELNYFVGFPTALEDDFLMLTREKGCHVLYLSNEVLSGTDKLCEFEIFGAKSTHLYLQKYFLVGKLVVPL